MGKNAITQLPSLSTDPPRSKGEGKRNNPGDFSQFFTVPCSSPNFTQFTRSTLVIPSNSFTKLKVNDRP